MIRKSILAVWLGVFAVTCLGTTVHAEEAPAFIKNTYPEQAIDAALQDMNALQGEDAALSPKVRELIGLGVAAQIPCVYCIYYHIKALKTFGASDAEIKEALAAAAQARKWSTILNGSLYDEEEWEKEVDAMFPSK
jgi:AhpD family alkylhydroperoxidase